jgi:hypothetical protein
MTVATPAAWVKATDRAPSAGVIVVMTGAGGGPIGVVELEDAEYTPVPEPFTAATWKTYAVPLSRPVTTAEVAAEVPSANVVHDVGLEAGAYWTT